MNDSESGRQPESGTGRNLDRWLTATEETATSFIRRAGQALDRLPDLDGIEEAERTQLRADAERCVNGFATRLVAVAATLLVYTGSDAAFERREEVGNDALDRDKASTAGATRRRLARLVAELGGD